MLISRRRLLASGAGLLVPWSVSISGTFLQEKRPGPGAIHSTYPSQDPDRVRAMVGASHGRIEEVQALLEESPDLAKATIDWGFGDWETALGAASHVGNKEIAAMLIGRGARPDLFTFAMLGQLQVVKAYIEASPGIQRIRGPHGLTLLHHAKQGGKHAEPVVAYLEKVGDADIQPVSLPMDREVMQRYVGSFVSETEESLRLDFEIARIGKLSVKREPYGSARNLHYLGNNEFAPVGGDAARIRFNDVLSECTVVDRPLSLRLLRI